MGIARKRLNRRLGQLSDEKCRPTLPVNQANHAPPTFILHTKASILSSVMCFYKQTCWACGFWKWGNFQRQCPKEYRIGETCGLKLVWSTQYEDAACKICKQIAMKQRRISKMTTDIERWRRERNRTATIEKTESDMKGVYQSISSLRNRHLNGQLDKHRYRKRGVEVSPGQQGQGGGRAS